MMNYVKASGQFFGTINRTKALRTFAFWAMLAFAFLPGCSLLAQQTGTVSGTVTDASGGAVVGAEVTLTSNERGTARTEKSDSRGKYQFSSVAPGTYSIVVGAPSYARVTGTGLIVEQDKDLRFDSKLVPADVSEQVTVQAINNGAETQSATLSVLIDPTLIETLPLDGENVVSLAALLPGVSNVSAPTTFVGDTSGPVYNVSGARSNQNLFLLDGSLWNNLYTNTGLNFPPPDSLQEVSVLLNGYKAQYGRNVGSVFSATTRSGSNTIHGVVYEYLQNTAFNAIDYFLKQVATKPSELVQNQFGGTIGGPILRDKLFYFGSVQVLRIAAQAVQYPIIGFTAADRGLNDDGVTPRPCAANGSFPGLHCIYLADEAGYTQRTPYGYVGTNTCPLQTGSNNCVNQGVVYNPLSSVNTTTSPQAAITALNDAYIQAGNALTPGTNSPCVNTLINALPAAQYGRGIAQNELPTICLNPVSMAILNKYVPLPNLSNPSAFQVDRTITSTAFPQNGFNGLIRLDYNVSHQHNEDMRYYQQNVNDRIARGTVASYEPDNETGKVTFGDYGDTWVIRPALLNVARAAYKRYDYAYAPSDNHTLADFGADFTSYNTVPVLPAIGNYLGNSAQAISHTVNEDIELNDALSWTKGNHNYQFGVDYLRLQYQNISESAPQFSFGGLYTGLSVGDTELGLPASETFSNSLNRSGIQHDYYFYAQDDWRITRKLTLNLGLRYELPLRYYQPNGQDTTFINGYQSLVFPNAVPDLAFVGDPGIRRSLIKNEYFDFAPRFGFALDVFGNGRTSIRGGIGLFYDATNALTIGVGEPFHYTATYAYPEGGISQPLKDEPAVPANFNGHNAQFSYPFSIFFPDKNFRAGYTEAINFGFQQSIGRGGLFETNYVLRLGRHQAIPLDQNPAIYDCSGAYYAVNPNVYCPAYNIADQAAQLQARVRYPGFNYGGGGVVDYNSMGTSNYNGLQVLYRQRATHGLTVTSSFSYAKSFDLFSSGISTNAGIATVDKVTAEYGPSDYDVKLTFAVGWAFAPLKYSYSNRFERAILNGWTQSGIYNAQTGQPFSVRGTTDTLLNDEPNQRANLAPGFTNGKLPSNRHRTDKILEWFNTAAYVNGPQPSQTNQSRNTLRGPAYILTTLSAGRVFPLPERDMRLGFRVDAIYAFNTVNLAQPGNQLQSFNGANTYGTIQSSRGQNSVGSFGRRLQFSLRLNY